MLKAKEKRPSFKEYRGHVAFTLPGLKKAREEQRFSQRRLAEVSGVSAVTINRIEQGDHATPDTFSKLVRALKVDPNALVYGDDPEEEEAEET